MILASILALATVASPADCLLEHELAHAGGWGADHPGAIYTAHCGHLPMPPHAFPLKQKPIIHRLPREEIFWHCGPMAQACSSIGGDPPVVILPLDANGNPVRR